MTAAADHAWLPRTSCTHECVASGLGEPSRYRLVESLRMLRRMTAAAITLAMLPSLAVPLPGRTHLNRWYCRAVLQCLGVRIRLSGDQIRNLRGLLVVSNHISWVDVFVVGAVLPGSFVARADLVDWPGIGWAARLAGIIPIERRSLRALPEVIATVIDRLTADHTVVAFPEGTTYCGRDHGRFHPAMFQAAIDAGRPVQPLRLSYRHTDGSTSTATAFLGEDSLWASIKRTVRVRRTVVDVEVRPLQLPGTRRGELAARCQAQVRGAAPSSDAVHLGRVS